MKRLADERDGTTPETVKQGKVADQVGRQPAGRDRGQQAAAAGAPAVRARHPPRRRIDRQDPGRLAGQPGAGAPRTRCAAARAARYRRHRGGIDRRVLRRRKEPARHRCAAGNGRRALRRARTESAVAREARRGGVAGRARYPEADRAACAPVAGRPHARGPGAPARVQCVRPAGSHRRRARRMDGGARQPRYPVEPGGPAPRTAGVLARGGSRAGRRAGRQDVCPDRHAADPVARCGGRADRGGRRQGVGFGIEEDLVRGGRRRGRQQAGKGGGLGVTVLDEAGLLALLATMDAANQRKKE